MHTLAYLRVSTAGQTTDNQLHELQERGFEPDTVYAETVSGSVPAGERPEFTLMLDAIKRTRKPKRLVVTKLDRLGRDASDIMATVKHLESIGCGVKVLQLGDVDLTSSGGKIILATLSAVAEVERDILIERTQAGLQRAKAEGKKLGRPREAAWSDAATIRDRLAAGEAVAQVARDYGVSRATIIRIRNTEPETNRPRLSEAA